jgi:amino acid efflux transporter
MANLTVPQGAALSVGAVLGTGVIGLPALASRTAGPASLVAWLGLVILSVPLAATFAALGARYPDTGGVATYVRRAFGDRAAAVVGWSFYFAVPVGAPAAALFAGQYVENAVGGGAVTVYGTCAALIAAVIAANAFGLRVSGRLQLGLGALLVALILLATTVSLPHARTANLHPFAPHGWLAVGSAATILVWSFAGWEATTSLAAEFRDPARDLPRVTAIAVVVVGVLYLGVATASILVLGPSGQSPAPLAELLARGTGGPVRLLAAVAAVLLTFGAMNAYFAGSARLGAALARDGALPHWLARGGAAGEVPRRSLTAVGGLSAASMAVVGLAGFGSRPLILLATGCFVLVYVLGTAAAVRLLPRGAWSRRAAVVAFTCSCVLLVLTGVYIVWPLALSVGALVYLRLRRTGAAPAVAGRDLAVAADPRSG